MMPQVSSGISRLPVQLLTKVLQHVGPQQALQSCALVSRLWQEAAVLSVRSINIRHCNETKATSLTSWLQARDAAVQDIHVQGRWGSHAPRLQLPVPRLPHLGSIELRNLQIISAAGGVVDDDFDNLAPWDVSELTALTHLDLKHCGVRLQGLSALTGLQELVVLHGGPQDPVINPINTDVLAEALPVLQHLTFLHLGGVICQDVVLQHASCLTCLQSLQLYNLRCTSNSFQQLPQSLTQLVMEEKHVIGAAQQQQRLRVGPASTPGLCRLTALQDLTVRSVEEFDIATVRGLTALSKLIITSTSLVAAADGPRLALLTSLSSLQHLVLPDQSEQRPVAVTPEDFAAITSSKQLTCLGLHHGPFGAEQLQMVFPAQRQMARLERLKFDEGWLQELEGLERVASCCPNLQCIDIMCTGGYDIAAIEPEVWVAGLDALSSLSRLTELSMLTIDMEFTRPVWKAIAALTGLRSLSLEAIGLECMGYILELTACRQLDLLRIGILPGAFDSFDINVDNQAPAGSPPDVWCQLPAAILQAAADNQEVLSPQHGALNGLVATAAHACHQVVRAQLELQQRTSRLEQQVDRLQAGMDAVLRHLQLPDPAGQ